MKGLEESSERVAHFYEGGVIDWKTKVFFDTFRGTKIKEDFGMKK